ncbi:MAG: FAD-dependent oxidoreductase [Streptosporangiaceae bacterium]
MLTPTTVADQLAAARDDRLRVLVVGAGVAGLTLAQLLRAQGLHPVLIERSAPDADEGYMLALMPLVDPVLRWLDVEREYVAHSTPTPRYRLHDRTGRAVREYSLGELLAEFGDYRGIERGELLQVISSGGAPVTFGCTVEAIEQEAGTARVRLADGASHVQAEFDAVVAADGLHSTTRRLVLRPDQIATYDTGWGGWVAWMDPDAELDLGAELWGAGFFVGTYPVKDRIGVFVGGARADTAAGPGRFVARVRDELRTVDDRFDRAPSAVAASDDAYYWSLVDYRAASWSVGRVVLLGDAAAGFLPTAGVGAAMAMESAGALAERLGRATPAAVPQALAAYERAQRPRVESAQGNSRALARLVFHRSRAFAVVRDVAARFVTLKAALRPIRKLLEQQPPLTAPRHLIRER